MRVRASGERLGSFLLSRTFGVTQSFAPFRLILELDVG